MTFSRNDLHLLKQLARIDCSEEEEKALLKKLSSTMEQISAMLEVDTDGVSECTHVIPGITNVMRDDEVVQELTRDELMTNAPDKVGGMIRTPPVLK